MKILYKSKLGKFWIEYYDNRRTELCPETIYFIPSIVLWRDCLVRTSFTSLQFSFLYWTISFQWM